MRLIIFGAPGAGKGTQARKICQHLNIPQISTGDMLREAIQEGSAVGKIADSYISKGELVPDVVILDLINNRISQPDCENGFLLDGFPRNLAQVKSITKANIEIDAIIELEVSDDILIERISGRRIHLSSGRSYHVVFNPPKEPDIDDITKESLIQRDDDREETVKTRLKIYNAAMKEMKNHYEKIDDMNYFTIDGNGNVSEVYQRIMRDLGLQGETSNMYL
ncbi:MAG: adenylate kinase [Legionellales bacterium]|nr:adenylate kinase [Legionellales bacterium]